MGQQVKKCASHVSRKQADLTLAIAALATESRARWPGWINFRFLFWIAWFFWMTSTLDISHSVRTSMQHFLCPGSRTWSLLGATGVGPGWMCMTAALVKMDLTSSLSSCTYTTFLSDWGTLLMPKGVTTWNKLKWWTCSCTRGDLIKCAKALCSTAKWFFTQTASSDCFYWQSDGQRFIQRAGKQAREDNLVVEKPRQCRSSLYVQTWH